jgi:hypothetical protein
VKTLRRVTVWRAVSQWVMVREREKAASSRWGERMRIFRVSSGVGCCVTILNEYLLFQG